MANENLKYIKDKFKAAGFTQKQTYDMLDLVDNAEGGKLLEAINAADKEGLGVILKEKILPVMQAEFSTAIEEYPESADAIINKEGAFVKSVDDSEWNRDRMLKVLGRSKGEDGVAHIGALTPGDYIALRRNGLTKAEADSLADKYRKEYQTAVAEESKATLPTKIRDARVQSVKDDTDWDKDPLGAVVGSVIAPRAVTDIMNQAEKGGDIELNPGVLLADIGEDGLMFVNPVGKGVGVVGKGAANLVGKGVNAITKGKRIENPVLKYGSKIVGETANGAAADGLLDAAAEGVAAASSDAYDYDLDKPLAVTASSATIPGLLGNAGSVLGQFTGGNAVMRGVSNKFRRGEKTPTVQKMELEQKAKWGDNKAKKAAEETGSIAKADEEGAKRALNDIDTRYPDYRKKGFTDANEYAKSLENVDRDLTDDEFRLMGREVPHFKGLGEVGGELLGSVLSPASQIYFRGKSDDDRPEENGEDYKLTEWYKGLTKSQKEAVDKEMKKKADED